ncbi:hypothetical protein C8R41DRAFT_341592 [Lentinula lateritia]|uniref:Uncharacterized protein n=1 Tax=Lentinula lateritia TaxID=40482 RepID=A0ABQ8VG10_9AGAR|nr:hypothetical protein C8R41DRAFT_341592 [Lentinula lateritia]
MIMLFNLMLVWGFASQVCALPPPSTPARKMSTRLSSMFKPKPGDVQQLEIFIHYEVIGTQKLPKVDSMAQRLVKAASRSSATEGAETESLRRVQARVIRKRNCEVFIEDISKNELDVLMWNATHDVVYANWK